MTKPLIRISANVWDQTWCGLRIRGRSKKESVCVWGGTRLETTWDVTDVVFLDDLPGVEGFALYHRVSREAVSHLFKILHSKKLELIADVHTHPGNWVGLSLTDQEHPLEYRVGFMSLVLPYYGSAAPSLAVTGVHEYLGCLRWKTLSVKEVQDRIEIRREA